MSGRPQGVLNDQILKDADLLVAIFWTRIGTPTGEAAGGSVEELEKHIASGKPAMVYFSSAPVRLDSVDDTQYKALMAFKDGLQGRGLYDTYDDLSDFRVKFARHLATKINDDPYFAEKASTPPNNNTTVVIPELQTIPYIPDRQVPSLTNEAKTLLLAAANDRHGNILHARYIGGVQIQAGGKQFIEDGNARSRAAWEGALHELERFDLIEPLGPKREVYQVTREGYRMSELLRD
jgi:hypothetical protein